MDEKLGPGQFFCLFIRKGKKSFFQNKFWKLFQCCSLAWKSDYGHTDLKVRV